MMMNILGNIPAESVNMIVISVTAAIIGLAILGFLVWNVACIKASNDAIRESNYAIKDKLNQIAESLAKEKEQNKEEKKWIQKHKD